MSKIEYQIGDLVEFVHDLSPNGDCGLEIGKLMRITSLTDSWDKRFPMLVDIIGESSRRFIVNDEEIILIKRGGENKMGSKFKNGDRIKIIKDLGGSNEWTIGLYATITGYDTTKNEKYPYAAVIRHNGRDENLTLAEEELEFANKKSIMGKIANIARSLLDSDLKKMVKAGLLNRDLSLTEEGKDLVLSQYVIDKKVEFGKLAEEILKEKKESKEE